MSEWLEEVLSRGAMTINAETDMDALTDEMIERLEAVMSFYNGCEPTADGWRRLAISIALDHHPLFRIVTPADRDVKGGKPVGFENFARRSAMKAETKKGVTKKQAAQSLDKKFGVSSKTLENLMVRSSPPPDAMARSVYTRKAEKAIERAASELSHKEGDF